VDDRILQLRLTALAPTQRVVRRENAFALEDMGAITEALAQAEAAQRATPGSFSDFELASLRQQALGQRLRWAIGERDQRVGEGAGRFERIDELLLLYASELGNAADHVQHSAPAGDEEAPRWKALYLRLYADHLVTLSARGRFTEVTRGLRAMASAASPMSCCRTTRCPTWPAPTSSSAAPTWPCPSTKPRCAPAATRYPCPATPTPAWSTRTSTPRVSTMPSHCCSQLEAATPPLLRLTPEQGRPNPEYADVRNLRALYQLYTERPWQAEASLRGLTSLAPFNSGFRAGLAETMKLRERPDEALGRYRETLADHPWDVAARAGYAGALFDAGEIRAGRELTDGLQAEAPESIAVRNAVAQRDTLRAPRLDIDADAGQGHGNSVLADRDWRVDAKLSSPLWDDSWRLFFRQVFARGDTSLGNADLSRSGVGVEYLKDRWQASAELHQADRGRYRTGVALGLDYRASDAWRLAARFDSNSLETPWKARLRAWARARSSSAPPTSSTNRARSRAGCSAWTSATATAATASAWAGASAW
jgi:biofilm PGA synthesis protein PgaA